MRIGHSGDYEISIVNYWSLIESKWIFLLLQNRPTHIFAFSFFAEAQHSFNKTKQSNSDMCSADWRMT